jgi:hypothetical protein
MVSGKDDQGFFPQITQISQIIKTSIRRCTQIFADYKKIFCGVCIPGTICANLLNLVAEERPNWPPGKQVITGGLRRLIDQAAIEAILLNTS